MKLYVADTHALCWYFIASPLLGAQAQSAFDEGKQGQALIYIPAIVLAELYFLNEKEQRPIDYSATFALLVQSAQFVLLPFEPIIRFSLRETTPCSTYMVVSLSASRGG